jgi:signal transduction histidine kinase
MGANAVVVPPDPRRLYAAPLESPEVPQAEIPQSEIPQLGAERGAESPEIRKLTGLAHDASNLATALRLCAELLAEPGVLAPDHAHYAGEMASMAEASAGLMRKLGTLARAGRAREMPEAPVTDVADELRQLGGLLAAMAGPKIVVQTACLPCAGTLRLSEENLTRILLNLVRNAADAMPEGGRVRIAAQRGGGASFFWTLGGDPPKREAGAAETVLLSVEDNGPGIRPELLERIFEPGFSTRRGLAPWPEGRNRGLGLSIARELVEEAGGTIRAVSVARRGARIEMELPVTNVTPSLPSEPAVAAENEAS